MINNLIIIKKTINKHITHQFNRHIIMIIYIETIYRYMNVNDDIILNTERLSQPKEQKMIGDHDGFHGYCMTYELWDGKTWTEETSLDPQLRVGHQIDQNFNFPASLLTQFEQDYSLTKLLNNFEFLKKLKFNSKISKIIVNY